MVTTDVITEVKRFTGVTLVFGTHTDGASQNPPGVFPITTVSLLLLTKCQSCQSNSSGCIIVPSKWFISSRPDSGCPAACWVSESRRGRDLTQQRVYAVKHEIKSLPTGSSHTTDVLMQKRHASLHSLNTQTIIIIISNVWEWPHRCLRNCARGSWVKGYNPHSSLPRGWSDSLRWWVKYHMRTLETSQQPVKIMLSLTRKSRPLMWKNKVKHGPTSNVHHLFIRILYQTQPKSDSNHDFWPVTGLTNKQTRTKPETFILILFYNSKILQM